MSPGPLRRLLGALGLLALAPVAIRLVDGSISPIDAAMRAMATLLVVVVIGRIFGVWLRQVAYSYERQGQVTTGAGSGLDRGLNSEVDEQRADR